MKQHSAVRSAIAAMGAVITPEVRLKSQALFDQQQQELASRVAPDACDVAYGRHERHRLDLYGTGGAASRPTVLFVHGGGFARGDKGGIGSWPNAAVGRVMAEAGFVGAVMNYRLAPADRWPAGAEDVGRAVAWLRSAEEHGIDPQRIVLMGTSAGAVHVADYLARETRRDSDVQGAILLSGLYGYTPLDPADHAYYGGPENYPAQMPLAALAETEVPLFVACAEFDPVRFQAEFLGLLSERLARHGRVPRAFIASGHNHYSMAMHLGTSDRRLADEILDFIASATSATSANSANSEGSP